MSSLERRPLKNSTKLFYPGHILQFVKSSKQNTFFLLFISSVQGYFSTHMHENREGISGRSLLILQLIVPLWNVNMQETIITVYKY